MIAAYARLETPLEGGRVCHTFLAASDPPYQLTARNNKTPQARQLVMFRSDRRRPKGQGDSKGIILLTISHGVQGDRLRHYTVWLLPLNTDTSDDIGAAYVFTLLLFTDSRGVKPLSGSPTNAI